MSRATLFMTNTETSSSQCQSEEIAAYLDGQLDDSASALFEWHVQECQACHTELNAQRRFICELDSTLAQTLELPIPQNFARIVAARAESDMRGVREGRERRRALRFSLVLTLVSFALLGATASKSLFFTGRSIGNKILSIFDLLWTTLHDAAAGVTVISRVISRGILPESHLANLATLFLLVLAVLSLSHLISSYHRDNRMRLFE